MTNLMSHEISTTHTYVETEYYDFKLLLHRLHVRRFTRASYYESVLNSNSTLLITLEIYIFFDNGTVGVSCPSG